MNLFCYLRRKIATLTYRSGPEWSERFGRKRIKDCDWPRMDGAEFEIEDYIRHQVGVNRFQWSLFLMALSMVYLEDRNENYILRTELNEEKLY